GHGDLRRPAELAHHRPAEKDQSVSFYLRPTERRGQGSDGPWARRFCFAPPFPGFGGKFSSPCCTPVCNKGPYPPHSVESLKWERTTIKRTGTGPRRSPVPGFRTGGVGMTRTTRIRGAVSGSWTGQPWLWRG